MAKATVYYPRAEMLHRTDRLPRRRCSQCGYGHQGQHEVCEVCREKADVTQCEPKSGESHGG